MGVGEKKDAEKKRVNIPVKKCKKQKVAAEGVVFRSFFVASGIRTHVQVFYVNPLATAVVPHV